MTHRLLLLPHLPFQSTGKRHEQHGLLLPSALLLAYAPDNSRIGTMTLPSNTYSYTSSFPQQNSSDSDLSD